MVNYVVIEEVIFLSEGIKVLTENRRARHDYFIEERFEAGIELVGTEVKSIRCGGAGLKDSFCQIRDGQLYVKGMRISPYEKGNIFNRDPERLRRLLMHKREILKLGVKINQDGYTLVPLKVYLKNSRVKIELGLAKGKKLHDKREDIATRDVKRELDRTAKEFGR